MKNLMSAVLLCAASFAYAGFDEGLAAHKKGDYSTAFKEFKNVAEQGGASVQALVGAMYAEGKGVPQDYAQAAAWYKKAAEQGYASAQYNLGLLYDTGQGVSQDYAQAVAWYSKAAEQGYASAQYNLGLMYNQGQGVPKNYKLAYILFNLVASKGESDAVESRDIVSKEMPPNAIADAQRITTHLSKAKDFAAELQKLLNAQK